MSDETLRAVVDVLEADRPVGRDGRARTSRDRRAATTCRVGGLDALTLLLADGTTVDLVADDGHVALPPDLPDRQPPPRRRGDRRPSRTLVVAPAEDAA